MKRAITTILLIVMLCGLPAMALAAKEHEISLPAMPQTEGQGVPQPTPIPDDLFTVLNEISAIWPNHQYPADVGGIVGSRVTGKLVVLLVNNTAARQAEIRRLVSYPNVLQFYGCKYSYAELSAVNEQIAQLMRTDPGIVAGGVGFSGDSGRPFPGFGASGYEMRVIVNAATKADYDRLYKELAAHFGDKVHVSVQVGVIVPTDGGAASGAATAATSVNVRSGPGTGYKKLGRLKRGDAVQVLDITNKWARIVWGDTEAYVYAKYLDTAQTGETDAAVSGEATAATAVNVRSGPGTGYQKLGRLKRGDAVQVLDVTNKWARITWDGGEAYVYAKYLRMI